MASTTSWRSSAAFTWPARWKPWRAGSRISVIGVLDGYEVSGPVPHLLRKSATVQGISVGHRRALENLVQATDVLGLKPVIDRRYPLDALPVALNHLDCGPFGKTVVEIG